MQTVYKLEKFDTVEDRTPRKLNQERLKELSKKVTTRKRADVKAVKPAAVVPEQKDEKLDEKLSAIVNDADIDI